DPDVAAILRIEDAQRVALEPPPAVLGKIGEMIAVIGDERGAIGLPARRVAERVELELGARQDAELVEDAGAGGDDLDIGLRLRDADQLDADLMELAEPALLRPL